jgi:hypothetical protein
MTPERTVSPGKREGREHLLRMWEKGWEGRSWGNFRLIGEGGLEVDHHGLASHVDHDDAEELTRAGELRVLRLTMHRVRAEAAVMVGGERGQRDAPGTTDGLADRGAIRPHDGRVERFAGEARYPDRLDGALIDVRCRAQISQSRRSGGSRSGTRFDRDVADANDPHGARPQMAQLDESKRPALVLHSAPVDIGCTKAKGEWNSFAW